MAARLRPVHPLRDCNRRPVRAVPPCYDAPASEVVGIVGNVHGGRAQRIVIIGAGQAGGQAAYSLRLAGYDGAITLIGDEPAPPYQRPPLSKAYLKGEMDAERLFLKPLEYYADHAIDLVTGNAANDDRPRGQAALNSPAARR